ncbi:MAG: hypothetical protein K6E43_04055 [Lachnospiraceae bacterium]|nr:hypothetical protein [Lachnospiraceae bacterium]
MKRILKVIIVIALIGVVAIAAYYQWNSRQKINFEDHVLDTAFVLNGEEVTFGEMTLYIVYEERVVEEEAEIYNPDNTRDYWNAHANGQFIRVAAKEAAMNMAIHTKLLCQMAEADGVTLDAEDEKLYRSAVSDFWMDMLDQQRDNLPVSEEYIYQELRNVALADKYQQKLVEENRATTASYNWDGLYYKKLLEEQDLKINNKIWDRISIGDITLTHTKTNYINGLEDKKDNEK